ncbi:unnamed protein product [Prorocentrum cordatum]|uniref:Histone-lysine N-methyltransferase, H3 lysine-79 specific n=1 Tax=Prorocentrum cordatum TaxID=2364126 RepID=A0ABN9W9W8_9DINO|nr:unnamed protein product [Polarella glacialis]
MAAAGAPGAGDLGPDLQEQPDDPVFAAIFPPSKKLDAYGISFADLAVFEGAGFGRDDIGKLATFGFITFTGMRRLLTAAARRLRGGGAGDVPAAAPAGLLAEALGGKRFLDLGSGDGRAVVAAALLVPGLERATGVELSTLRHEVAERGRAQLPEALQATVRFEQADILQVDAETLGGAHVVYVANLRFPDAAVDAVNAVLDRCCAREVDAVVATLRECPFSRPHEAWVEEVPMSWNDQGCPVYCYHLRASRGAGGAEPAAR